MVFGFTESFRLVFGAESASVINVKPLLPAEEATTTTQESQTHRSASINANRPKDQHVNAETLLMKSR